MAKNMEMALLFDFYGGLLTEKQRDAVDQYYNQDLSLSEIAENQGITRQGVRDAVKRAEATLTDMEAQLGLAGRFRSVNRCVREIGDAAREILALDPNKTDQTEIRRHADRICKLAASLQE